MKQQGVVAKWKTKKVNELGQLVKEYPTVGLVDMGNLPSKTLLSMKRKLCEDTIVRMSRKRLIRKALTDNKLDILSDSLEGQPALILSKKDPFRLARFLNENSSKAPAKPGTILDEDIIVPAGDTDFAPGPIVSELTQAGVKAGIDKGKVIIKEDSPVALAGVPVTKEQANAMAKLGIEPMEIKLKILAAHEEGMVFKAEVLNISTEQTLADVQSAASRAFNLAFNAGYTTKDNIKLFIGKAYRQAKALATEVEYVCSATVKDLLGKAHRQMEGLKAQLPDEPVAAKEAAKEEGKTEDKPAEESKPEESAEAPAEEKREELPAEEKKEDDPVEEAPKEEEKTEEKPTEEAKPEESASAEEKPEEQATEAPKESKEEKPAEENTE